MATMQDPIRKIPTRKPTRNEGWGADLDPADRPAVPMEKPSFVRTVRGSVPERQSSPVKVFMSIEHPDMTPVFGTACPPRGLSGALRNVAYRYSEGRLAHWLTLMLADRVDVVEGLLSDLVHFNVPNIPRERGWRALLEAPESRARTRALIFGGALGLFALGVYVASRRAA